MKSMNARGPVVLAVLLMTTAALTAAPASAAPTDDEVAAAPDDVNLNLDYARAQADNGNLLNAAGALERILIAEPDRHGVRLFYVAVLYRLDDRQQAADQLRLLDSVTLSAAQRAEADKYRRLLAGGPADTGSGQGARGSFAIGLAYQEDATGALVSQYQGFVLPVEDGVSAVVSGRIEGATGPGSGGVSFYGSMAGYSRVSIDGPGDDFQRGEVQLGVGGAGPSSAWRLAGVARHYRLSGDPFLTEYGARAGTSWRVGGGGTRVILSGEAVRQKFDEPDIDAISATQLGGGTHDGARYDLTLGLRNRAASGNSFGAALGVERKTASYNGFDYTAPHVQADYNLRLGGGAYVDLFGSMSFVTFDNPDVLLFGAKRKDTRTFLRAALGSPLGRLFGGVGRSGPDLEGAVNYVRRDTRAPLSDYDSFGAELRLVWRFGARN